MRLDADVRPRYANPICIFKEEIVTSYMHWLPARYLWYVRSLAKNGGFRAADYAQTDQRCFSCSVSFHVHLQPVMTFLSMFSASLDPAFPSNNSLCVRLIYQKSGRER